MPQPLVSRGGHDVNPDDGRRCSASSAPPTERTALVSAAGSGSGAGAGAVDGRDPLSGDDDDDDESSDETRHPVGPWRGLAVGVSLWLLIFLEATNMSGMAIIQGPIAQALGSPSHAPWFTTAYLIAVSSLAPLFGRLAAIFSPRVLVLPVALLFSAGALLASSARSVPVFIAGRVVAGAGAGGVLALSVIFVLALVSKRRRGVCIGLVNAGITAGVSFGAVVYGGLLSVVGWRPLFWMQAPCALAAGVAVFLSAPTSMRPGDQAASSTCSKQQTSSVSQRLARIDYLGAVLLTATTVLFLYGLAGDLHPLSLLLSPLFLAAFLLTEYRLAADPVIPLAILSSRGILLSCLAQLGLMSARWSLLYFAPIFMLAVRGTTPATSGSILVPTNLGFTVGGVLVGWLHIRHSGPYWLPCIVSFLAFAASLLVLAAVATPGASLAALVVAVFVNGMTTGAALNYTLAHLLHLCHPGTDYVASSLLATFRGFGGSFGTSIGGGVFYRFLRDSLTSGYLALDGGHHLSLYHEKLISLLQGMPHLVFRGDLSPRDQQVALQGYASAIRSVWKAAGILVLIMVVVQAATGWTPPPPDKAQPREEQGQSRTPMGDE
ncbi:major facilitator superfamily protein [Hirsutella rhossiliensis]|uniref:Major facilitator superfamily domain-containing protein n=1 Tax=Hirsutella rhossiliensis TaxID=111463 RepID=A0A9P8SN39_9HYPO|nr:major facilitator superfamily domain-containing protein [Hirsutella rhossiliensis]KAH0967490.1 major facilitator superfamily domain-containing protein [Hirsutella rhossiliensis]